MRTDRVGPGVERATVAGSRTWGVAAGVARAALLPVRAVAFWTAVSLPVLYPLLLLGLLPAGVAGLLTLLDLLALHTLTLVLGRRYGRTPTSG
jgi:hypothetical protein